MILLTWRGGDVTCALTWAQAVHVVYEQMTALSGGPEFEVGYLEGRYRAYCRSDPDPERTPQALCAWLAREGLLTIIEATEEEDTNQNRYRLMHAMDEAEL